MSFAFGRDINFRWFPFLDDEALQDIPSNQEGQLSIHVYASEGRPSLSEARAGTGKTGPAITSWTPIPGGYQFTIPAIPDPDPTSETRTRIFWVAINFILKSAGQVQTVVEPLVLTRFFGQQTRIGVSPTDVLGMDSNLIQIADENIAIKAIEEATESVKGMLSGKYFEWARIKNPEALFRAVKLRAGMWLAANETLLATESWANKRKEWAAEFEAIMKGVALQYDADSDNKAEETKAQFAGMSLIIR